MLMKLFVSQGKKTCQLTGFLSSAFHPGLRVSQLLPAGWDAGLSFSKLATQKLLSCIKLCEAAEQNDV